MLLLALMLLLFSREEEEEVSGMVWEVVEWRLLVELIMLEESVYSTNRTTNESNDHPIEVQSNP